MLKFAAGTLPREPSCQNIRFTVLHSFQSSSSKCKSEILDHRKHMRVCSEYCVRSMIYAFAQIPRHLVTSVLVWLDLWDVFCSAFRLPSLARPKACCGACGKWWNNRRPGKDGRALTIILVGVGTVVMTLSWRFWLSPHSCLILSGKTNNCSTAVCPC